VSEAVPFSAATVERASIDSRARAVVVAVVVVISGVMMVIDSKKRVSE
jgi:hypothetical protein